MSNYKKALSKLDSGITLLRQRELSDLEKQGLIQAFEFTYELAWKAMKDYLQWQGIEQISGPRDTVREAFAYGLVTDGESWMNMLVDRNKTSHTYNEETANEIISNVEQSYIARFQELKSKLESLLAKDA